MDKLHHPTKEQVRQWLAERWQSQAPLPDAALIRCQLGWGEAPRRTNRPLPISIRATKPSLPD